MDQGLKNRDVTAIRPPTAVIQGLSNVWGVSREEALWNCYMPHVPYTPRLTLEQAAKLFPYQEYCDGQATRDRIASFHENVPKLELDYGTAAGRE